MRQSSKQRLLFTLLFGFLGFIVLQIPVARLVGSRASFTLFDAFAPTAGAFLGTMPGVIAVLLMQLSNFVAHGALLHDLGTLIRFLPPLFATMYFAKPRARNLAIPLLAVLAFNLHPTGRSVWYYSFYWLIPVCCHVFHSRSLLARSFGATFTAHAVGGSIWIWFFNLPKSAWIGLIPVVAFERTLFAFGIAAAYVFMTNVVYLLGQRHFPSMRHLHVEPRYLWHRLAAWAGNAPGV